MSLFIIVLTCVVSIYVFNNQEALYKLIYIPYNVKHQGEWYRVFTHAFIHANWPHLIFNMMVLYFFGDHVITLLENRIGVNGNVGFLVLYFGGILFSSVSSFARHSNNSYYSSLGASGAVSAVLYAFILMAPTVSLYLFFIPIPIPAFIVGIGYLVYEAKRDKQGNNDGIAHDAHFWGAVFGIVFIIVLHPQVVPEFFVQISGYINGVLS